MVSLVAVAWPVTVLFLLTRLGTPAARMAGLTLALLLLVFAAAIDAWHVARIAPGNRRRAGARWYVLAAYLGLVLFGVRPLVGALAAHVLRVYRIDGVSMSLTLESGDRVVATPLRGPVRPRMVVVWRTPGHQIFVHRVIGMPGDTLEMRNFMLLVNGLDVEGSAIRPAALVTRPEAEFAWQREFLADGTPPSDYHPSYGDWGPIRVPRGRYFLLGDNRYGSRDSRQRGFVAREQIVARVRWILVSTDDESSRVRFDRMGRDVQ